MANIKIAESKRADFILHVKLLASRGSNGVPWLDEEKAAADKYANLINIVGSAKAAVPAGLSKHHAAVILEEIEKFGA